MPYSSGGGSSSGGSYSGSESGNSEHSRHRISNKLFDGARRYMYHDEYGHNGFFTASQIPEQQRR